MIWPGLTFFFMGEFLHILLGGLKPLDTSKIDFRATKPGKHCTFISNNVLIGHAPQ